MEVGSATAGLSHGGLRVSFSHVAVTDGAGFAPDVAARVRRKRDRPGEGTGCKGESAEKDNKTLMPGWEAGVQYMHRSRPGEPSLIARAATIED